MSKKAINTIERIPSVFTTDTCALVMIPLKGCGLTILNGKDIVYHYLEDSKVFINKYLQDERRCELPYVNIPYHHEIKNLKKQLMINVLLNYNEPYIEIQDDKIIERFVVKDNDEALMITREIVSNYSFLQYCSYEEAREICESRDVVKLSLDGSICNQYEMPTEDDILDYYKETLIEAINEEEEHHERVPLIKSYAKKYIDGLTIADIPEEAVNIPVISSLIMVSDNEIKSVDIDFICKDHYEIRKKDYPIKYYTLEQAKEIEEQYLIGTHVPKFNSLINKDIDKKELKKVKKLTLEYKK